MANRKISELTSLTSVAQDDLLAVVDVSASETKKITRYNLVWSSVPVAHDSTGVVGQLAIDTDYLYVCTAPNVWMRTHLSSW